MQTSSTWTRLFAIVSIAAIAGCGGGGGGAPATPISFSGKVIDGFIAGATVCIDLNSNLACDPGEPSTTSGADGSYTLSYNGANPIGLPILAIVTPSAKDSDDNGKSLAEVGKAPYNLATPITQANGGASIPVTPLSTLVMHTLLSDSTNTIINNSAITTANGQVQRLLGTSKDLLTIAPTKDNESDLHKVGQVIAIVLGDLTKQASNTSKTGQIQAGTAIMASVLPQIVTAGKVDSAIVTLLGSADKMQVASKLKGELESKADYSSVISGTVANIALNTQLTGQEKPSAATVFKEGITILQPKRFHPETGNPFPNDIAYYTENKFFRFEFIQYLVDTLQLKQLNRYWYKSDNQATFGWAKGGNWGDDFALTQQGTWVLDEGVQKLALTDNCVDLSHAPGVESTQRVCMSQIPLGGKRIADLVPDLCASDSQSGFTPKASCSAEVFSEGSYGLNLTASESKDIFLVNVPRRATSTEKNETYYCNQMTADSITGLTDLLLANQASSSCRIYLWDSFSVRLQTYNAETGTGTLQSSYWNGNNYVNEEAGTFRLITVNNNKILVIPPSQGYHRNNPGEMSGQDFIVAKVGNGIYTGTVSYADTRKVMNFGNIIQGNLKMAESIFRAIGITSTPPYGASEVKTLR